MAKENEQKTLGERIKLIRDKESQTNFATRFGVSRNTILRYESGLSDPLAGFISALCENYRINPAWLLLNIGPKHKESKKDIISEIDSPSSKEAFLPETAALADSIDNWFRSLPQFKRSEMTVLIAGFLKENELPESQ